MFGIWPLIATSLIGVVGLLYGLLEHSKCQAAVGKADTISKSLVDQITERENDHEKSEQVVGLYKAEIDRLTKLIDDTKLTNEDLRRMLSSALAWGVQPPTDSTKSQPVPAKSAAPATGSDAG